MGRQLSSKKCLPGCNCGRHRSPTVEERLSMSETQKLVQQRVWSDLELRRQQSERTRLSWENPWSGLNSRLRSERLSEVKRGKYRGQVATGHLADGYWELCNQFEHPLSKGGQLVEHRLVLWEKLGCEQLNCEHSCYWSCG